MAELARPLLIAVLVLTEVGMWQWRMVIAARGRRFSAVLLGAAGAVLQITAITQVVTNVGDPLSVAAYATGVGIGVFAGLAAGERLTPGKLGVTVTTTAPDVATRLRARGWPAIATTGHNDNGPVTVLFIPIELRQEARLYRDVAALAPDLSWSSGELRQRPAPPAPGAGLSRWSPRALTSSRGKSGPDRVEPVRRRASGPRLRAEGGPSEAGIVPAPNRSRDPRRVRA